MVWRFLKKDGSLCEANSTFESLWDAEVPEACWVEGASISRKVDAEKALHEFAIWCVRRAGCDRDPYSLQALRIKEAWLAGKATDGVLKEAAVSARNATFWACETYALFAAFSTARLICSQDYGITVDEVNRELERRLDCLLRSCVKTRWERLCDEEVV